MPISGTFPSELANLGNGLHSLICFKTLLSGTIPRELGALTSIKGLYVCLALYINLQGFCSSMSAQTRLSGTIPSSISSLTKLRYLDLGRDTIHLPCC